MAKIVYLMRHGQTLFNELKKVQGWCDSPLTELGKEQAGQARQYFQSQGIQFGQAYASTQERACDTLEIVCDLPYQRKKGLKEWNFGRFEGEPEFLNPPLPYGDFFVYYGGESQEQLMQRMNDTMQAIMQEVNNDLPTLVVSHGAACRNFMRVWEEFAKTDTQQRLGNCCILKFAYEDEKFILLEIVNPNEAEKK